MGHNLKWSQAYGLCESQAGSGHGHGAFLWTGVAFAALILMALAAWARSQQDRM